MCSSIKYPFLLHRRDKIFSKTPPFQKRFRLSFINFFNVFGLPEPLTPQEFPLPSVGGGSTDIFWNYTIPVHFLFG